MYRTRQYRISRNHILYDYCRDICRSSAVLYNRANFILRQYSSSVDSMAEFKPLFPNQMIVYRLVRENLSGTKYLGDSKWLSYNALDHLLKATRDKSYYALPAQANQQILKLLLRDYKSFFEAVKAYGRNHEAFTGRPKMPGYMSQGSFKTAILTNQICRIKDGCLKFPGTKDKLSLGKLPEEVTLKEVRIKPCGNSFVLDVVLSVPDKGMIPMADKDILADLSDVVELKDLRVMAIDPGTDNIAAVANSFGARPFVIKGGVIKSINQFYNKEMKRLSSCAMTCNNRYRTRKMNALTEKRNRRIKDQFHKVSRQLADYARDNHVDVVVMGHNTYQKQKIGIGHVNNQNFVQIPMLIFADMLRYKLAEYGIRFVLTEESYTSKSDYLAKDYIPVYKKNRSESYSFSGKRIHRGLYRHYDGTITNADINGAANILRKVFPKVSQWDRGIVDMPCSAGCVEHPAGSCRPAA
ncbi:RNA-guided endonuclease InsQ/TnpB family protein [Butyrivibrio sp. FCS014]|uniref:RNA-guided endonuclease InsQ/TnpB family protein n=1 Tax=Butyrivibrio sp. FCS014 TaxID=1408304 RepID=UPI0004648F25|nr:RNA-guided endonuclease TnpB family protein [Butyrivibrio sp. FCS014]